MDELPPENGVLRLSTCSGHIRVLVVEEELGLREFLNCALTGQGFTVQVAGGGQEAVNLFRTMPGEVDVVLLDWGMADMNGPATLAALREVNPRVRCCFMTGGIAGISDPEAPVLLKTIHDRRCRSCVEHPSRGYTARSLTSTSPIRSTRTKEEKEKHRGS